MNAAYEETTSKYAEISSKRSEQYTYDLYEGNYKRTQRNSSQMIFHHVFHILKNRFSQIGFVSKIQIKIVTNGLFFI